MNSVKSCYISSYFTFGFTSTDEGAVVTLSIYGILFIAVLSTATVKGFTGWRMVLNDKSCRARSGDKRKILYIITFRATTVIRRLGLWINTVEMQETFQRRSSKQNFWKSVQQFRVWYRITDGETGPPNVIRCIKVFFLFTNWCTSELS
jgi:hypothetical protein